MDIEARKIALVKQGNLIPPITEIRKNIGLDTIIAEQQTVPIGYSKIQKSTQEIKWNHSLKDLLEALK